MSKGTVRNKNPTDSPSQHFASAPLTEAKWDCSLVFTEKRECWDRQARRGLRVSAIKRPSRWIIVKVAWAKLIAASPFALLDLYHLFPRMGSKVPEWPEEWCEGQGRERERGNGPTNQRKENDETEPHVWTLEKKSKLLCSLLSQGSYSVTY